MANLAMARASRELYGVGHVEYLDSERGNDWSPHHRLQKNLRSILFLNLFFKFVF